jgi:hypothetical protein
MDAALSGQKTLLSNVFISQFICSAACFLPFPFIFPFESAIMSTEDKSFKGDNEQVIATDADELQLVNAPSKRSGRRHLNLYANMEQ